MKQTIDEHIDKQEMLQKTADMINKLYRRECPECGDKMAYYEELEESPAFWMCPNCGYEEAADA
jgi:DNA-directed RNA polymerase subunit M/transcription elongation factor TFIIS